MCEWMKLVLLGYSPVWNHPLWLVVAFCGHVTPVLASCPFLTSVIHSLNSVYEN